MASPSRETARLRAQSFVSMNVTIEYLVLSKYSVKSQFLKVKIPTKSVTMAVMGRKILPAGPGRTLTGLYYARESRGMSRTELVRLSGVSKQQLSRLENGAVRLRLDHLRPFANALGYSPEQILLWGRYPGTPPGGHIESSDVLRDAPRGVRPGARPSLRARHPRRHGRRRRAVARTAQGRPAYRSG